MVETFDKNAKKGQKDAKKLPRSDLQLKIKKKSKNAPPISYGRKNNVVNKTPISNLEFLCKKKRKAFQNQQNNKKP